MSTLLHKRYSVAFSNPFLWRRLMNRRSNSRRASVTTKRNYCKRRVIRFYVWTPLWTVINSTDFHWQCLHLILTREDRRWFFDSFKSKDVTRSECRREHCLGLVENLSHEMPRSELETPSYWWTRGHWKFSVKNKHNISLCRIRIWKKLYDMYIYF